MRVYLWIFLIALLSSCQKTAVKLENFDTAVWQNDSKGCKNERLRLLNSLENQKEKLLGLSQEKITEILGRPDKQVLQKRNAKLFVYYVSEGSQCGQGTTEGVALIVQFGALNYVSEIYRNRY
ncbi:MAG: hypothetical protein RMJ97_03260 [Raineya sp.]|nr:hypothetical protein [Raineya sp.]MDW8295881.1 hypothetical protein [Raineya sp.]